MKKSFSKQHACVIFVVLLAVFGSFATAWAATENTGSLDLALKIGNLEDTLKQVEKLIPPDPENPMKSPSMMIRSMLQGTQWVDPERLIVLGVIMAEPNPEIAAIIPYAEPNSNFQSAYSATAAEDAYLIALPPGSRPEGVSETMQQALFAASNGQLRHALTLDVAVQSLLAKAGEKIQESIAKIGEIKPREGQPAPPVSEEAVTSAVKNLLDLLRQMERISESMDISGDVLRLTFNGKAADGSELAKLLVRGEMLTLLDSYRPEEQINFRSGRYDYQGVLDLLDKLFGEIYAQLGVDIGSFAEIMDHFTGEMAGGMSVGEDGMRLEMISVLKPESRGVDFIEGIYLPWMRKYMQQMTEALEDQAKASETPAFTRTPDSTVAGRKVYGIQFKMPAMAGTAPGVQGMGMPPAAFEYELRMVRDGDFFIIAPDDDRLAELLTMTLDFKEDVNAGSLFAVEMDWAAYLAGLSRMAGIAMETKSLPETSKMTILTDMYDGRVDSVTAIRLSDIRAFMAYSKQLAASGTGRAAPVPAVLPKPADATPQKRKKPVVVKDADYWTDQGALVAVYGNDAAAVKYYRKALALDPEKSDALFLLAMSHSALGNADIALENVNLAISLDSENGTYYYGRGRIYLLAGREEQALSDFRTAADLGNEDAQQYLMQQGLYPVR